MLEHFTPAHLPVLFIATTQALGGLIPILFPTRAILDFGLRLRNSNRRRVNNDNRPYPLDVLRAEELVEFDTILAIFGSWVGCGWGCLLE
jgi:hypothetical protein